MSGEKFEAVLVDELKSIGNARRKLEDSTPIPEGDDVFKRARGANLWGLAFSGGGIRSATFNLGVLQALAHMSASRPALLVMLLS